MIPRLTSAQRAPSLSEGFVQHLAGSGFKGDIGQGAADRTVFATDNSIYQVEPAAILFPKDVDDLKRIARALARRNFRALRSPRAAAARAPTASR